MCLRRITELQPYVLHSLCVPYPACCQQLPACRHLLSSLVNNPSMQLLLWALLLHCRMSCYSLLLHCMSLQINLTCNVPERLLLGGHCCPTDTACSYTCLLAATFAGHVGNTQHATPSMQLLPWVLLPYCKVSCFFLLLLCMLLLCMLLVQINLDMQCFYITTACDHCCPAACTVTAV